jgi:NTE family protein
MSAPTARRQSLQRLLALGATGWMAHQQAQAQTPAAPAANTSRSGSTAGKSSSGNKGSTAPMPPRLAVVLGGGSARGFAHIGVVKALEAQGIRPDLIVGSSAGALVGAFWAAGHDGSQMERLALQVRDSDVIDLIGTSVQGRRGLVSGQALQMFVNAGLRGRSIDGLPTPFAAVATRFPSGELQVFQSGEPGFAVRASCSIPGVFMPANQQGQDYLDGGLVSPIPVRTARQMGATFVVAVDVGADDPKAQQAVGGGMYELIVRSFEIMGQALRRQEAEDAHLVIRPDVGRIASTDFSARRALIDAGYKAGMLMGPVIKQRMRTA